MVEPVHPLQRRQLHGLPVLLGKTKSCLGLVQAIESDTQSALGHSARNWRLTLSSGHDLALSLIVVLISLPRRTLCRPSRRIGRSTVQRDHHTFPQELPPDLTRAVDLEVILPDSLDIPAQYLVTPCSRGALLGGGLAMCMGVVRHHPLSAATMQAREALSVTEIPRASARRSDVTSVNARIVASSCRQVYRRSLHY